MLFLIRLGVLAVLALLLWLACFDESKRCPCCGKCRLVKLTDGVLWCSRCKVTIYEPPKSNNKKEN